MDRVKAGTTFGPRIGTAYTEDELAVIIPLCEEQFGVWANFSIVKAEGTGAGPQAFPEVIGKKSIAFTSRIEFHGGQAVEIWSFISGVQHALKAQRVIFNKDGVKAELNPETGSVRYTFDHAEAKGVVTCEPMGYGLELIVKDHEHPSGSGATCMVDFHPAATANKPPQYVINGNHEDDPTHIIPLVKA